MTTPPPAPSRDTPLLVTTEAMQACVQYLQDEKNHRWAEGCGFLVAKKGEAFASSWVPMENVDPDSEHAALMDPSAVRALYADLDESGAEPLAVVHSHLYSAPLMSERDLANAVDNYLAYMVVSLEGPPKARAYRVTQRYIGMPTASEVVVRVGSGGDLIDGPQPPVGPWILTPGNSVRIDYQRTTTGQMGSLTGRVKRLTSTEVAVTPTKKGTPEACSLDRVRHVHLISEGNDAIRLRREMIQHARHLAASLGSGSTDDAPRLAEVLAVAYPAHITTSIEEVSNPSA